jgi:regulator of sigma E protease
MTTVISTILVIGAIIFFHELGHLLLAKRAGILCREFAIGFGPKVFSVKKGETLYTFRLLPLGGYVRMAGEEPEAIEIKPGHDVGIILNQSGKVVKIVLNNKKDYPEARTINVSKIDLEHRLLIEGYDSDEQLTQCEVDPQAMLIHDRQEVQIAPHNRQFGSKTIGQRISTIFAGPLANFLLAFFVLFGYALYNGVPVDEARIGKVHENTRAEEAGLQQGDLVLSANHEAVDSWRELVQIISSSPEKEVLLIVERNGEQLQVPVTPSPFKEEGTSETRGIIGVSAFLEKSFKGSIDFGAKQTYQYAMLIFSGLGQMISGGVDLDDLAGPVGIINMTGEIAKRDLSLLLHWTAALSVNVGILNLLPIPALDGGRLIFLGLEALRGRPIDPHKEGLVHVFGFALLMLLILVVTWNDIQRLFFN